MKYFLLLLLPISLSAQSPWARSKGGFYVQASYNFIPTYGSLFGPNGDDLVIDHLVSEQQVQLYGEYGLTQKTTVVLALPYVMNKRGADNPESPYQWAQEDTGSIAGLGNIQLAVRHQFKSGKLNLAGTLKVSLPTAKEAEPNLDLRTGYNALTIQPMFSAGMGFRKAYGFAYGSYGYRSNEFSHFFNGGFEAGVHLGPVWLIGFSDIVVPFENGSRPQASLDLLTGLYANDQGWVSIGAKAIWEITRNFGINASFAGAAWAQNVPKSPGIGAGCYFKWR